MPGQTPPDRGWVTQTRRRHRYAKLADGDINFVICFDRPTLPHMKPQLTP